MQGVSILERSLLSRPNTSVSFYSNCLSQAFLYGLWEVVLPTGRKSACSCCENVPFAHDWYDRWEGRSREVCCNTHATAASTCHQLIVMTQCCKRDLSALGCTLEVLSYTHTYTLGITAATNKERKREIHMRKEEKGAAQNKRNKDALEWRSGVLEQWYRLHREMERIEVTCGGRRWRCSWSSRCCCRWWWSSGTSAWLGTCSAG